jgi:energy-converting hydrogenase B subunit D
VNKVAFIDIISIAAGALMVVLSVLALNAKKIFSSVIYLSLISMLAVVSFAVMRAPDVAITEAVIGSGLVTALFIFTLYVKGRESDKA